MSKELQAFRDKLDEIVEHIWQDAELSISEAVMTAEEVKAIFGRRKDEVVLDVIARYMADVHKRLIDG